MNSGLWSAHFHLSLYVFQIVCNKCCRWGGAPENTRRSSYMQARLLLPTGQRSVQPPALQRGRHCDGTLKYSHFTWFYQVKNVLFIQIPEPFLPFKDSTSTMSLASAETGTIRLLIDILQGNTVRSLWAFSHNFKNCLPYVHSWFNCT